MNILSFLKNLSFFTFSVVIISLKTTSVFAKSVSETEQESSQWSFSVGAGAFTNTDYSGSDDYETMFIPWFDIRYGDYFFANFVEGIGFNLIRESSITAGLAIAYGSGRDNEGDLEDIESVDDGALANAFANYQKGMMETGVKFSQAISGDIDGQALEISIGFNRMFDRRWITTAKWSMQWNSKDWNDALFSIRPAEANVLNVSAYSAGSGISETSIAGSVTYLWTQKLSTTGILSVGRLLGEAADSPIVDQLGDATQSFAMLVLNYRL